jgi:ankyrin repeat protein
MDHGENIWVACSDGDMKRVIHLLSHGAGDGDVNAQDAAGYSPLHAAASYDHIELARLLLDRGADVHIKDEDGDTPIQVCESAGMFDLLVTHGADPFLANYLGETLQQRLVDDQEHELLTHLLNYAMKKGLGDAGGGVTVRVYEEERETTETHHDTHDTHDTRQERRRK